MDYRSTPQILNKKVILSLKSSENVCLVRPCLTGLFPPTCGHPTWQFSTPNNCLWLRSQDTWGLGECCQIYMVYVPSNPNSIFHNQDRITSVFCVLL